MSASLNQCNFIGNLGRDPESKVLPGGDTVCNFSIACSESWKDKATGERKEMTEWVNVVIYGKLAEVAAHYLRKGSQVFVSAKVKTRKWQDKEGKDRYTTEFVAHDMKMLGSKPADGGQQSAPPAAAAPASRPPAAAQRATLPDDDIPF